MPYSGFFRYIFKMLYLTTVFILSVCKLENSMDAITQHSPNSLTLQLQTIYCQNSNLMTALIYIIILLC